jgi:hypothetical protein
MLVRRRGSDVFVASLMLTRVAAHDITKPDKRTSPNWTSFLLAASTSNGFSCEWRVQPRLSSSVALERQDSI